MMVLILRACYKSVVFIVQSSQPVSMSGPGLLPSADYVQMQCYASGDRLLCAFPSVCVTEKQMDPCGDHF